MQGRLGLYLLIMDCMDGYEQFSLSAISPVIALQGKPPAAMARASNCSYELTSTNPLSPHSNSDHNWLTDSFYSARQAHSLLCTPFTSCWRYLLLYRGQTSGARTSEHPESGWRF